MEYHQYADMGHTCPHPCVPTHNMKALIEGYSNAVSDLWGEKENVHKIQIVHVACALLRLCKCGAFSTKVSDKPAKSALTL